MIKLPEVKMNINKTNTQMSHCFVAFPAQFNKNLVAFHMEINPSFLFFNKQLLTEWRRNVKLCW